MAASERVVQQVGVECGLELVDEIARGHAAEQLTTLGGEARVPCAPSAAAFLEQFLSDGHGHHCVTDRRRGAGAAIAPGPLPMALQRRRHGGSQWRATLVPHRAPASGRRSVFGVRRVSHWVLVAVLVIFGFLTGFSIGMPFLLLGIVLAVLAPCRHRRSVFWPPVLAVPALVAGYLLVAPLGCTATTTSPVAG